MSKFSKKLLPAFIRNDPYAFDPSYLTTEVDPGSGIALGVSDQSRVFSEQNGPLGMYMSDDGVHLYICGTSTYDGNTDAVVHYTLSTPYDLSTATVSDSMSPTTEETTPNMVMLNPDGSKLFVGGSSSDFLHQYTLDPNWDLSSADYDDVSLDLNPPLASPIGGFFADNGNKFFATETYGIAQWTLSSPYDLSNPTYDGEQSLGSYASGTGFFSNDGMKFLIGGHVTNAQIYTYSVTSAFDITGGVTRIADYPESDVIGSSQIVHAMVRAGKYAFLQAKAIDTIYRVTTQASFKDVGTEESNPQGATLSYDGTKMFVVGTTGDSVDTYNLSRAFILNSAEFSSTFVLGITNPYGIDFSHDGLQMFIVAGTAFVYGYSLSTAWDVSTATLDFTADAGDGTNYGISVPSAKQDDFLYVIGNSFDAVYQLYRGSPKLDLGFNPAGENGGVQFADSGNRVTYSNTANDAGSFELGSPFNFSSLTRTSADTSAGAGYSCFSVLPEGKHFLQFFVSSSVPYLRQYSMTTPWDYTATVVNNNVVKPAGLTNYSARASFQTSDPSSTHQAAAYASSNNTAGIFNMRYTLDLASALGQTISLPLTAVQVADSGTKMYITDTTTDDIHQFTLNTAYDLNDFTFVRSQPLPVVNPYAFAISGDGMKVLTGNRTRQISQYNLSTAWDVSTIGTATAINLNPSTIDVNCIRWDDTGYYYTVMDYTADMLREFEVTTQWDATTTDLDGTGSTLLISDYLTGATFGDFHFADDGYSLYLSGSTGVIAKLTLSTAYDIGSTATKIGEFDLEVVYSNFTIGTFYVSNDEDLLYYVGDREGFLTPMGFETAGDITSLVSYGTYGATNTIYPNWDYPIWVGQDSGAAKLSVDAESMCVANNGDYLYYSNATGDLFWYSMSTPYDISTATTLEGSKDFGSEVRGISFNDTGTRMILMFAAESHVYEYALSAAWDITTAELSATASNQPPVDYLSYSVLSEEGNAQGVSVSQDGKHMVVTGTTSDDLHFYTLDTPFSLENVTEVGTEVLTNTNRSGVHFSWDGKYVYAVATSKDTIEQYKFGER